MLPRSTHTRSAREAARGKQTGRTQEIQRLIGRSLRAVTDLKALGERTITVDCDVLQADGGTRTASITGGYIALAQACETVGLMLMDHVIFGRDEYFSFADSGLLASDLVVPPESEDPELVPPLSPPELSPDDVVVAASGDPWAVQQLWLFWVAPLVGGLLAGLFYQAVLAEHEPPPVVEKPVTYAA